MCGILGFIPSKKSMSEVYRNLETCLDLLTHRGPDSVGSFHTEEAFLGIRRLSIQDEENGTQPFVSKDRKIWVVGNGEIYNFRELRNALNNDESFTSNSDVEVVLHGYEAEGISFVDKLRGMYSLLIVDLDKSVLIAIRDRIGEKPLYVHQSDAGLVISSEIRPVIKAGLADFEFDETGLQDYLQYGFPIQPNTLVKNFRHVMPGTYEVFSLNDLSVITKEYWTLDGVIGKTNVDEIEKSSDTLSFIEEKVLKTEVNCGIALSTGLDSSSLMKLSSLQKSIKNAYHLRFLGVESAEADKEIARIFAQTNSLGFEDIPVTIDNYIDEFWEFHRQADQPIADWSGVSYNLIARRARENGEKVLIFGQGPDELFWGYNWVSNKINPLKFRRNRFFGNAKFSSYLRNIQKPLGRYEKLIWLISGFGLGSNLRNYVLDTFDARRESKHLRLFETRRGRYGRKRVIAKLLGGKSTSQFTYQREFSGEEEIEVSVMKLMIETYLRSNGLLQLDVIGMRNSIEIRNPYVDYKLVEKALVECHMGANIPKRGEKVLFKEIVGHLVTKATETKSKVGFLPPVNELAKKLVIKNYERLAHPELQKHLKMDRKVVKVLLNPLKYRTRVRNLWLELYVLEAWLSGILSDKPTEVVSK